MKRLSNFLITLALLAISTSMAQSITHWEGEYTGTLIAGSVGNVTDSIPVTFNLREMVADSVWEHKMTFHSERYGTIVKDYRLIKDKATDSSSYVLDERNGIQMQLTLLNDALYGMYTVLGTTYVSTLRRLPDGRLLWDLFGAPVSSKTTTFSDATDQMDAMEVVGLKPSLQQTVFLSRAHARE